MKPAFAADAARRRSEHDPGTHAEAFRSGVQRMGSGTATSVIWVGHESARCARIALVIAVCWRMNRWRVRWSVRQQFRHPNADAFLLCSPDLKLGRIRRVRQCPNLESISSWARLSSTLKSYLIAFSQTLSIWLADGGISKPSALAILQSYSKARVGT
jgi:hypothetical protein